MRYFVLAFFVACIAVVSIAGFQGSHSRRPPIEIFPDMVRQAKLRPQTPNDFFGDQMSSRRHAAFTVPHTKPIQVNGEDLKVNGKPVYSYEDSPVNTGKISGTTNWV